METRNQYIAPKLTVVTFKPEWGYASSNILTQMIFWNNLEDDHQVENYTQHDVWNDGDGFWN